MLCRTVCNRMNQASRIANLAGVTAPTIHLHEQCPGSEGDYDSAASVGPTSSYALSEMAAPVGLTTGGAPPKRQGDLA